MQIFPDVKMEVCPTIGFISMTLIKHNMTKIPRVPVVVYLTKDEVDSLKGYCDDNLAVGAVKITQEGGGGIGFITKVQIPNLPDTLEDITDIDSW